jgi:metal-responsive CopG/Arc/MetJ family transcriptional regulator
MKDAVVKIDGELLARIEKLIKENKFLYTSNKQAVNLAIIEFLKKHKLNNNKRKR